MEIWWKNGGQYSERKGGQSNVEEKKGKPSDVTLHYWVVVHPYSIYNHNEMLPLSFHFQIILAYDMLPII